MEVLSKVVEKVGEWLIQPYLVLVIIWVFRPVLEKVTAWLKERVEKEISKVWKKVTDWLIEAVKKEITKIVYFFSYERHITSLETESLKLKEMRIRVQQRVIAAQRNLQVISSNINSWLTSAEKTISDADRILERRSEVERGCFYGWFPNLKSRFLLGKESDEIAQKATKLQTEGEQYDDKFFHPVETGIVPSNCGVELQSRKDKEEEVMKALVDECVSIIGIWGMGGIGKSTLAEKIRKSAKHKKLFDEVVKVDVSQTLDLHKIQRQIAGGIGLTLTGKNLCENGDKLLSRLSGPGSVLVILDDVWKALHDDVLQQLGIPIGSNHNHRCKVIVTTRLLSVCDTMGAQMIEVGTLSKEEAWVLFRHYADNSVDDPSLHGIAKAVAQECRGLPLALKIVAGALKRKEKHFWEDALKQLQKSAPAIIDEVIKDVYKPLKLSYDHLESKEARHLFLLCSLFEEDSDIQPEYLLRYGMGLGIFSNLEAARKRVHNLLKILKDRFLLTEGSRKGHVKMHDLVRDVAIYFGSERKHVLLVSHDVNSQEFPRKETYQKYTHMSIVAKRLNELPQPISCPRLELLMLKLFDDQSIKLQDNFFARMSKLNVLSVRGTRNRDPVLPCPASIKSLSNLRTLCLSNLRLEDISIIGKLVNLKILSIRDSALVELPVEIGELKHLIMLELWNKKVYLKSISLEVLSRLVLLEELYIGTVESPDEIHMSNLNLSSKWTRYALKVGKNYMTHDYSFSGIYDRSMDLQVTEITPLGDWIRCMLRKSELVCSRGSGSKNVLTELMLDGFSNLKDLRLTLCDSLTHLLKIQCQKNVPFPELQRVYVNLCPNLQYLICLSLAGNSSKLEDSIVAFPDDEEEGTHITFPNLYEMDLQSLQCFTHFCNYTVEGIEFSQLRKMRFWKLPKFKNFWPASNTMSDALFDEKVLCPRLEELELRDADSVTSLFSHQHPTGCFSNLERLEVWKCSKLRNLMTPSVARGFLNLQILEIEDCPSMEEVITKEEVEEMNNESLFPQLVMLLLSNLPKLGHFFLTEHALQILLVKEVDIADCPEMKTFTLGSVSTPSLENLLVQDPIEDVEMKGDLNKAIQKLFNSKEQEASHGATDIDESETSDA